MEQVGTSRLVFAILGKGHRYESLETIKSDLNPFIVKVTPQACQNADQIQYLSTSTTFSQSCTVFENDRITVEDFSEGDDVRRQLIFNSKPTQIQSELPLAYRNPKAKTFNMVDKTESDLMPKKKAK